MTKTIFTFGSDFLKGVDVNPMKVMLVVEAKDEYAARDIVFNSFIGREFCTSYPYEKSVEFKNKYGMKEYSLEELEKMKE